jgi:diadenosine tetraphosphate (Ap4A) HIT family hydrolase
MFELHPNLARKTFIADLPLCRVLFEDEKNYPWIFLVPRRENISRIMDLEQEDQLQLLKELDWAQKVIWEQFKPVQLNVAAIGNKTPQLHVHVIGRKDDDPAWPGTVWDHPVRCKYSPEEKEQTIQLLSQAFHALL